MRARRHLVKLHKATRKRLVCLKLLAGEASRALQGQDRAVAFVTIELLSTWANFVRSYYLSCWLSPVSLTGRKISLRKPMGSSLGPLGYAITKWRPRERPNATGTWDRRREPTWHDPKTLLVLASDLRFTNLQDIQEGLSGHTRAFIDLPVQRNFFAHRGHETFRAAMDNLRIQHGVVGALSPSGGLVCPLPGRPQALLGDWIDDISLTAEYLCM